MAPPSYTPLAAQQQQQGGSMGGITNPDGSPLTPQQQQAYYQWLMQRGQGGQPQQIAPKGQSGIEVVQGGLLKKLLGSGADSGAGSGSMGNGVAVGPVASGEAYGGMLTSNIGPVASGEMYGGELATNSAAAQPFNESGLGRGVQGVGGALQAYNGYNQYKNGQKIGGAANIGGGAFNTYAALSGQGGSYVPYVGAAVGAANIGQQMLNKEGNSEDRAAAAQAEAAKAAMMFIPVYGQAAYAALAGIDAVTGGKGTKYLTKGMEKTNQLTDKIDFGLGKSVRSKIFHQNTRGKQMETSAELMSKFKDDPQYQAFVSGMRKQYEAPPPDPSKPFAGKYATFDEYKKAGLQANDLTGTERAIRGGGAEYTHLSPEQQQVYTQALINADQFQSGHGGVGVKDLAAAQKIFEDVKAGGFKANTKSAPSTKGMAISTLPLRIPQANVAPTIGVPRSPVGVLGQPEQAQTMIPGRSKTRSPGIDLQGRRLKY
ncbi:MAG: hypothetical protein IPP74_14825 [Alphaproteobacteria bacterium]|nr:hypothetical protein [Alphaproteobacteria bacterium]